MEQINTLNTVFDASMSINVFCLFVSIFDYKNKLKVFI